MYFRLTNDCLLIEGEREAVLYDVHGGRLHPLDAASWRLLRRCEQNVPLRARDDGRARSVLARLQEEGLGAFHAAPIHVEKFLLRQPLEWTGMCSPPPPFFRVDWAITNACDLGCRFCGRGARSIAWEACQTCVRRSKDASRRWLPPRPEEFVAEIAALGAKVLHIRGGNPLLEWAYLRRLAAAAQRRSLPVQVTAPGTGRPPADVVELFGQEGLRFNLAIVATASGRSQDALMRRQVGVADALADAGIDFSVTFVVSRPTPSLRRTIVASCRRRWGVNPAIAETRVRSIARKPARWKSPEEFFARVRYNPCTCGNFEIGADGTLRTCAGLEQAHGDVAAEGLIGALSHDGLYESWRSTKSGVLPCQNCVERYACHGCTAYELSRVGGTRRKAPRCLYRQRRVNDSVLEKLRPGANISGGGAAPASRGPAVKLEVSDGKTQEGQT